MHKENYHLNVTSWLFNPYRRLPHYTTKWENLHYLAPAASKILQL